VHRKNGDYVRAGVGPTNRSEEARFGLADGLIVAFFLLFTSGVVCLFLLR
jgi:hypothetical protein